MIIVLDLDDTLYDELSFVKSGFKAVALWLYNKFSFLPEETFSVMLQDLFQNGRGQIFDSLLKKYGVYTKQNVKECIRIYRKHKPDIKLYPEAEDFLERFKKYPIYVVTDGNKNVQKNKIISLGLDKKVKFCYLTHCYGIRNAKPSPYWFNYLMNKYNLKPEECISVGDCYAIDGLASLAAKVPFLYKESGPIKEIVPDHIHRIKKLVEIEKFL